MYSTRLATVSFFCLFTREGDIEYTGYGYTEHIDLKARVPPYWPSCPDYLEEWDGTARFLLNWKFKKACSTLDWSRNAQVLATVICSCKCMMEIINAKLFQNSLENYFLWYASARKLDFCYLFGQK